MSYNILLVSLTKRHSPFNSDNISPPGCDNDNIPPPGYNNDNISPPGYNNDLQSFILVPLYYTIPLHSERCLLYNLELSSLSKVLP